MQNHTFIILTKQWLNLWLLQTVFIINEINGPEKKKLSDNKIINKIQVKPLLDWPMTLKKKYKTILFWLICFKKHVNPNQLD